SLGTRAGWCCDYSSVADLGESGVCDCANFSRRIRSALRASDFTVSKSKSASNIAVTATHAQMSQNKINQTGCSRGLRKDCKMVDPENKSTSATTTRANIVLRRRL